MIEVEPTCRYCQRRLSNPKQRGSVPDDVYICYCKACESEQTFKASGQPTEYSFMVGDSYCLHFWPQGKIFKIVGYKNGRPDKYLLEMKGVDTSHMRPDNMTEERVKCLIVFS
jgi:hypothetical protein